MTSPCARDAIAGHHQEQLQMTGFIAAVAIMIGVSATHVSVIDGDTIRIGTEHVRLLGIDAPELHRCPRYRHCAPGDPVASRRNLQRILSGRITISRGPLDRYGRTLAHVYANGRNVACAQLAAGMAIYREDWDNGQRLREECPAFTRP
jgi:endonuclease YncB( thermonuclease family)